MKNLIYIFLFIFLKFELNASAQKEYQEYISQYSKLAIDEARRSGVPASITMAQAILESSAGKSILASEGNNHFGIKCHSDWTGKTMHKDDDAAQECFRVYESAASSFKDHSDFLKNKKRYEVLFLLPNTDYMAWAYILKECGYATNPKYPDLLVKIIEDHQLYKLDTHADSILNIISPSKNTTVATSKNTSTSSDNSTKKTIAKLYKVSRKNGLNAVILYENCDLEMLAKRTKLSEKNLSQYNDLNYRNNELRKDDIIYLEKKSSGAEQKFHVIKEGESTWQIAQLYGVQMSSIYKFNKYFYPAEPKVGETIYLNEKRKDIILLK